LEYLFQDVSREAKLFGIEFRRPALFPQNPDLATKVAVLACKEGFGAQFCHAAMSANYRETRDITRKDTVQEVLELFCSPSQARKLIKTSQSAQLEETLKRDCEIAINRGVFGVPTLTIGDQLFWGNDRLDQALAYAGISHSKAALASANA
jgi:2-hydroxychromene-2-carboxylate isomerase